VLVLFLAASAAPTPMGWMEASGRAKWPPRRVKYTPPERGQVSFGWGEEAVSELDVSDQVVVVKDTGDRARLG
jgi:hypothetical protein